MHYSFSSTWFLCSLSSSTLSILIINFFAWKTFQFQFNVFQCRWICAVYSRGIKAQIVSPETHCKIKKIVEKLKYTHTKWNINFLRGKWLNFIIYAQFMEKLMLIAIAIMLMCIYFEAFEEHFKHIFIHRTELNFFFLIFSCQITFGSLAKFNDSMKNIEKERK